METQIARGTWQRLREPLHPEAAPLEELEQDDLELWLGCYRKDLAAQESSHTPLQLRVLNSTRSR
jgi:hypothetical protein